MPANIVATIRSDERVFVTGKTGSGKTYLARHLLKAFDRLMVLDSKGSLRDWSLDDYDAKARDTFRRGEASRVRVLADAYADPSETWERAMIDLYESGNAVLYCDEMYAVVDPGKRPPAVMNAIWTRGRELGIGAWGATQRPVWVPLFALSEADHFFMFRLNLFEDRRRMSEFVNEEVMTPIVEAHGFYYYRTGEETPTYQPILYTNGRSAQRAIQE